MSELSSLPNIGRAVDEQLCSVGIKTCAELKELGAEKAWLMIQQADSSACIHRLLALEGAILGIKKTLIPEERKKKLKEFYMAHRIVK